MNRNLVVGGVVFGLILAGLSVGISTFIANRDVDALNAEVRALADTAKPGATPAPVAPSVPAPIADYLPVSGGVASDLAATGYIWSKGDLIVTDSADDAAYLFSVDATDGARVYGAAGLTVDEGLEVGRLSELSDVISSGKITAAGLVQAASFSNATGSFVAGANGGVRASLLNVTGPATFAGNVAVASDRIFQIGETGDKNYVRWDPSGHFVVVGKITVNEIEVLQEDVDLTNVQADSFALNTGNGSWDASGTLTTKSLVVTDDSLKVGANRFVVDAGGATLGGALTLAGTVTPTSGMMHVNGNIETTGTIDGTFIGNISSDVDLTNPVVRAWKTLGVVANKTSTTYVFEVDNAGNVTTDGTIAAKGKISTDADMEATGLGTFGRLSVLGTGISTLKAVSATTITATSVDAETVTGDNLPAVIRFGVERVTGGSSVVTVAGLPATASVTVTPQFDPTGTYYVTVAAGTFTITGDNGDYSWLAAW